MDMMSMVEGRIAVSTILQPEDNFSECLMCDHRCDSIAELQEHVMREHAYASQTFDCDRCDLKFKQRNRLERHTRAVHEKRRPHQCSHCDVLFAEKNNLLAHMDTVHEQKRNFTCHICPSRFGRKNNLHRHVQTVHEKRRPYKCPCCSMSFGEKGNLLTHTRRKHGNQLRKQGLQFQKHEAQLFLNSPESSEGM